MPCITNTQIKHPVVVYPLPWPLLVGGVRCSRLWSTSQLLRPSGQQCSHSGGVCPRNPGATMWCVCGCSWRDDVCRVCGCHRGGIVVMDVFWRRLCVSMIWGRDICLFWAGQGCDEWGGEVYPQSCQCVVEVCAVFWLLPLAARCLETIDVCILAHVCFYVCCSDCVGVCGNVRCVAAVVKNSEFVFSPGVLKYVACLRRGCNGCCVLCLYWWGVEP